MGEKAGLVWTIKTILKLVDKQVKKFKFFLQLLFIPTGLGGSKYIWCKEMLNSQHLIFNWEESIEDKNDRHIVY